MSVRGRPVLLLCDKIIFSKDSCSNILFAILNLTAAISACPGPPVRDFEHEEGRRWSFLDSGMLACILLRVEWLPALCSFHLASDTAVARPRLWIVVAKAGTSDGSQFTTKMWIGSGEFGIGISYNVVSRDTWRSIKIAVASVLRMAE
eukprot:971642-Pelagomonas_calceolata.AAC.1